MSEPEETAPPPARDAQADVPTRSPPPGSPAARPVTAEASPGAPTVRGPGPRPPERVGAFRIERELGRGAMGVVYLARDERLGRRVALKLLARGAAGEGEVARFQLEAQAAARLRHPNLVAVHEAGSCPEGWFLAMDLIEGRSLARRLSDQGPLPPREAAEVLAKLARAVQHAHEHAILHRDIKPGNVLQDGAGEPFLADFGLAKDVSRLEPGLTRSGQVLGTPSFMAPEQATGELALLDRRTDVYGLGATLYALLTGRPPFQGDVYQVIHHLLHRDPTRPGRLRPGLDRALETVCLAAMAREPERRYATAAALAEDLERWLRHEPIRARRPGPTARAALWLRRHRALSAALGAGLALLVAIGAGATLRERARARERLVGEAREAARLARGDLAALTSGAPGERIGRGLRALSAAQRWVGLAPGDREAAAAQFQAALELGDLARAAEQWDLAVEAYASARGLSIDETRAAEAVAAVGSARRAEADRRLGELEAALGRAARGELGGRAVELSDAVFALTRWPGPETEALLAARLDELAAALRASRALDPGQTDLARVTCEALGRVGSPDLAGAALARYLEAEPDQQRAVVAAIALCRLGARPGGRALLPAVGARLARWGSGTPFYAQVAPYLARADRALTGLAAGGEPAARHLAGVVAGAPPEEPGTPEAWLRRARDRFAASDAAGALAACDQGLSLARAAEGLVLAHRAEVRRRTGDARGALADLDAALALAPEQADLWHARALARSDLGDDRRAVADLDRALELNPSHVQARITRGSLRHQALGDTSGGLSDLSRAIELAPEDAGAHYARGLVHVDLEDRPAALADLTRALELDPGHAQAWGERAALRQAMGDLPGALGDWDRCLALAPDLPEALWNRAVVRQLSQDAAGAEEDFGRVLTLQPAEARAWGNRGLLRAARGDAAGARADLRRALELGPDLPQAGRWRARLGELPPAPGE